MRLSIRDVLWLTAVMALVFGWWLDRSRLVVQHESELHETEVFMYSELERVERTTRDVVDAAWERKIARMLEAVKRSEDDEAVKKSEDD